MVKHIVLSCEKLFLREQAHPYLAQMLELPAYYGHNLDALYDCLTEMGEVTVAVPGAKYLRHTDSYGPMILTVLEDAARANPNLHLDFS